MAACHKMIAPAIIILLLFSCKSKDRTNGVHGTLTLGRPVQLIDQQADAQTGILYVEKPGDSLDGLMMFVADPVFAASRKFKISYQPITAHTFGPDFNPVSPLITISCGGGYSDSAVTMEIPVHLNDDQFAMGFLYDERTGEMEGMPLLKLEKDRVVVAWRNFKHSTTIGGNAVAAQASGPGEAEVVQIVMSAIDKKDLRYGTYDSKFRPGEDDCPSTNYGSVLAPGGHCSGQSEFMMWYYNNKKKNGAAGLFKTFEADGGTPTPKFWQDDTRAMRFSSLMQIAYRDMSNFSRNLKELYRVAGMHIWDENTMDAFAYAIRFAGEPQYIEIRADGLMSGGHAMVIYRVENDQLYVADPNYPGITRKIIFDRNKGEFLDYNTALNADGPNFIFRDFFYMGYSALLDHTVADQLWKDMEKDELGKGKFPGYTVMVNVPDPNEVRWIPFTDGFKCESSADDGAMLSLRADCSRSAVIRFYENGQRLTEVVPEMAKLSYGDHKLGIGVFSSDSLKWIGFRYVNVTAVKVPFRPPSTTDFKPMSGEPMIFVTINGQDYQFSKCWFSTDGKTWSIGSGIVDGKYKFDLRLNEWKGEGEYNNVVCNWMTNQGDAGDYYDRSCKMTVTKWGEGKLEANFSFTATDDYYKKTVTGTGFFRWRDPSH